MIIVSNFKTNTLLVVFSDVSVFPNKIKKIVFGSGSNAL